MQTTMTTEALDSQGIGALQDAMQGIPFKDTDKYGHTDLRYGYRLGEQLKAEGWLFVSSEYEEADYYREPRFTALVARDINAIDA